MIKRRLLPGFLRRNPRIGLCLSGGGCKAFYALGIGKVLNEEGIHFNAISATSAGTAMALSIVENNEQKVMEYFCDLTSRSKSNFHLDKLIRGERPFPHERMYRQTIQENIDLQSLQKKKTRFYFNSLKFPKHLFPSEEPGKRTRVILKMINAYRKEDGLYEKKIIKPLLTSLAVAEGLQEVIFTNKDFIDPQRVEDIVLTTSSAPPFVSLQQLDQEYYLDGGVFDNVPVRVLPKLDLIIAVHYQIESRQIVEKLGRDRGRNIFWICPTSKLPINMWDYANPAGVRATYQRGIKDGKNIMRILNTFF
ncbi:MAG: patatin-like phospholipase family protein [Leptospiraceae bacterium]|nr:patatin-like phospholipase family protein [Leptospiraceae bacterium]